MEFSRIPKKGNESLGSVKNDLKKAAKIRKPKKREIKLPKPVEKNKKHGEKEYPDVVKIVETIAMKEGERAIGEIKARLQKIDEMSVEAKKEKS
ncbi:MAG: hypothetical protein CM15mV78_170 [uncultured marine virus]|nr:MAG: hypothetical protein CM15mV78_170 [uncultured marine virus]